MHFGYAPPRWYTPGGRARLGTCTIGSMRTTEDGRAGRGGGVMPVRRSNFMVPRPMGPVNCFSWVMMANGSPCPCSRFMPSCQQMIWHRSQGHSHCTSPLRPWLGLHAPPRQSRTGSGSRTPLTREGRAARGGGKGRGCQQAVQPLRPLYPPPPLPHPPPASCPFSQAAHSAPHAPPPLLPPAAAPARPTPAGPACARPARHFQPAEARCSQRRQALRSCCRAAAPTPTPTSTLAHTPPAPPDPSH